MFLRRTVEANKTCYSTLGSDNKHYNVSTVHYIHIYKLRGLSNEIIKST
jgi:hypothetical protein